MKTNALKISVDSKELQKTLERLPANLNERVRKKGARKALAPFTKEMAALWRSASYRGKGTHRRAIAAATQLDIRRLWSLSVQLRTFSVRWVPLSVHRNRLRVVTEAVHGQRIR